MTTMRDIQRLVEQIARQFKPERVILFGSYCCGTPTEDSDVDLLVVMPGKGEAGGSLRKQIEIRQAIEAPFPLDLLVRSGVEIAERIAGNDYFIRDIVNTGKLLYEVDDSRMGGKGGVRFSKRTARTAGAKTSQSRRSVLSRTAVR